MTGTEWEKPIIIDEYSKVFKINPFQTLRSIPLTFDLAENDDDDDDDAGSGLVQPHQFTSITICCCRIAAIRLPISIEQKIKTCKLKRVKSYFHNFALLTLHFHWEIKTHNATSVDVFV